MEPRTHFRRKLIKFNMANIKKNSIVGRSWDSAKLFVLKTNTAIADRDVQNIRQVYQFTHPVTLTHKNAPNSYTNP